LEVITPLTFPIREPNGKPYCLELDTRAVLKKNGPLGKTRKVQSLLYSLNAEGSILEKVHPFREKL
jgi:hypothetical protein